MNEAIRARLEALNTRPLTGHFGESRNEILNVSMLTVFYRYLQRHMSMVIGLEKSGLDAIIMFIRRVVATQFRGVSPIN